ncbi:Por secretion system C-terminal sorting domain-containing protein [Dyadobacter sp. SG02]|uniref:T9SS type A sorting domain-containing protein n=1 Tax=Dyadobacter sp. SG02 TaxID=1855291 RepID=UPI0008CCB78D|nr:T9SS type A sorting domain-containing protein [Dyadobacter sp. SG02]SEJ85545.1 Por secretion system C-terminal sorting domain-containing protein [Dyadobacter sp. SG02]
MKSRFTFLGLSIRLWFMIVMAAVYAESQASTYSVTSTADAGPGTLRAAITDANADVASPHTINFNILGTGVQTITLASVLPGITRPTTINGYSQPGGASGTFLTRSILIRLVVPGGVSYGMQVNSSDVVISGLNIITFGDGASGMAGIHHDPNSTSISNNVWIWGCNFGTDETGSTRFPGQVGYGLAVYGNTSGIAGPGNASTVKAWTIGTNGDGINDDQEGNIFSTQDQPITGLTNTEPIRLFNVDGFVFAGNYFGLANDGITPLRPFNSADGQGYAIVMNNCIASRIGSDGNGTSDDLERNIFAGINGPAIGILGNLASGSYNNGGAPYTNRPNGNNQITGNYFGTDKTGLATSGALRTRMAIQLRAATYNTVGALSNPALRNVIVNSFTVGIRINGEQLGVKGASEYNNILGNYIGVLADGTTALANQIGILVNYNTNLAVTDVSVYKNRIEGNIIANNNAAGIAVNTQHTDSDGIVGFAYDNTFSQNSIYANGNLGINLGNSSSDLGVTPNDGLLSTPSNITGNRLMDYGVIKTASLAGNTLSVTGYIGVNPAGTTAFGAGAVVEFFIADDSPDDQKGERIAGDGLSLPHGEGKSYLGTLTADANGLFSGAIDVTGKGFVAGTSYITNTATEMAATGSTSEFGVNVTPLIVSGSVLSDLNGMSDNLINGNGANLGGTLYAALYDKTTQQVVGVVPVNADGTYTLTGAISSSEYSIYLTTTAPIIGQFAAPAITLPADWSNTGEANCPSIGCSGDDGQIDGILDLGVLSTNAIAAVFGIQQTQACQSYLQIRQKSLSEEGSPNFTFSVTGGGSYTLNDSPDAVNAITHISGDAEGGLFAVAAATDQWVSDPGTIYYKASGNSVWQNTGALAFKVQGGSNGGYTSLVRSSTSVSPDRSADQIKFKLNSVSSESDITLNLAGERFLSIAHNYDDILYVLVRTGTYLNAEVGTVWKKSVSDPNWVSTGITDVQNLTALPGTNRVIYAKRGTSDNNFIFGANNDNTGITSYGNPIPLWDDDRIEEMAVTYSESGQLEIWALSVALIYKSDSPNSWVQEQGINDMRKLASTGTKLLYSVLLDDASDNIPYRIFLRTQDGVYLDDERVRPGSSPLSNTVNIPVAPGTYTITQSPTAGWHITDIRNNEGTAAGSSTSFSGPSATVVVSCGEVVVVEFENQLDSSTPISQLCGDASFTEDFSSYKNGDWGNPLDGLISYHKATGNFGYGYYAIMPTTAVMTYGDPIFDHTSKDVTGSMLVVDATFEKGIFYRRRFTGLLAGGKYSFGSWITNFNPPAGDKPDVSFEIYDANSGALITSVSSGSVLTSEWQNFTTVFASDGTDIELVLRNNRQGTAGNDLAIDDISFGLAIPSPEATATFDCSSGLGTLTITSPTSITGNEFEYSIDGGSNWQTGTVFTGLAADAYSVLVRYAGIISGCQSTADFEVEACLTISGTVYNDAFGLAGSPANTVDGTPIQSASGTPLYANLFTNSGVFVASVPVDASGTYNFPVSANTNYLVTISSTSATNASTPSGSVGLPSDWVNTGENVGAGVGSDGSPNGTLAVTVGASSVSDVNFGLDQQPNSNNVTNVLASQPPVGATIGLNGIASPLMNGLDPEDGAYFGSIGATNSPQGVVINSLPTQGELWYYGSGSPVLVTASDIINGTLFTDPSLFVIILTGSGYTSTTFEYAYVDAAGVQDPTPATYTISWEKPLPVRLAAFDAFSEGAAVSLRWITAMEENSEGFEIERSANAKDWSKIGYAASKSLQAASTSALDYSFSDPAPLKAMNYYRLKMIDHDGTFAYSQIRVVRLDGMDKLMLYPNPVAQEKLTIDITNAEMYRAQVFNVMGVRVLEQQLTKPGELNIKGLVSGVYVLRLVSIKGDAQTKTFVVR